MKMKFRTRRKQYIAAVICVGIAFLSAVCPMEANAAEEEMLFGSASYNWDTDKRSEIGIYAASDEVIEQAEFTVSFDPEILSLTSADADEDGDGKFHVSMDGNGTNLLRTTLEFTPVRGGATEIVVEDAVITTENGEVSVEESSVASVWIEPGADCALTDILVNGVSVFTEEGSPRALTVSGRVTELDIQTEPSDIPVDISDTVLSEGENTIRILSGEADGDQAQYVLHITREADIAAAPTDQKTDGSNVGAKEDTSQEVSSEAVQQARTFLRRYAVIAIVIWVAAIAVVLFAIVRIQQKRQNKMLKAENYHKELIRIAEEKRLRDQEAFAAVEDLSFEEELLNNIDTSNTHSYVLKKPEISVRNVTMDFKREKDEATSVKELTIRTLKGQREVIKFRALDNISFDVYKGEVVGIIGTNGSGKSTILKIISGALRPTQGSVEVNRSKLQLLTLGTGFDMELTGKENVYLNGSLIGYSKAYIDEVYDDIVSFAELEGFMDEKVRNYSSGMVSRLGFAIATTRDAPDILILDEVLSVGDMFFKKKSERRIQEMIHGGSTVLIVSHSTAVIEKNCTKVIWIEKGRLRAIGNPKEVCRAYSKMTEEK